jgi:hypothetical protein
MSRRSKISQTPLNPAKPRHSGVLFLQGVPQSTKTAFKAACAKREVTMRDAMITFMREFIYDNR